MSTSISLFMNPAAIATYVDETPKKVPGLSDLHRMTTLLLSERAPEAARVLVVGAGGGLELKAMAQARPGWSFTGVDPSPAMLDIARQTIMPFADQIELLPGTVDQVPSGPFDGATCLLTLHFLDREMRLHVLKEICCRLRTGSALVVAHHAAPDDEVERWLARSAAFANRAAIDPKSAAASAKAMVGRLPLLTPADEEALLLEAGFRDPALFYAAFSFRGWVATAS